MTAYGRKKIFCSKVLPSRIGERFMVVVKAEDVDKAVKKYQEQGYKVREV